MAGVSSLCSEGCGSVFKMAPAGTVTTVHYFHGPDGESPYGGLALTPNGILYGTTQAGGNSTNCPIGCGTVFAISTQGTIATLHSFVDTDGSGPQGTLLLAWDGNLYGTTPQGGTGCTSGSCGTIFKITPTGTFTTLYNFHGTDGSVPEAPLVQSRTGNLYGRTLSGGLYGYGTVFEITLGGTLTTLHNFDITDGEAPTGALVQDANGNFWGTTTAGGLGNYGTVFVISPSGHTFNKVHNFSGGSDGGRPLAGLVLGTDGHFYGATSEGNSSSNYGTLFEMTPHAVLTTLHTFDGTDGGRSVALMQATNGTFYGTTGGFGANNDCPGSSGCGTAFSLSTGLGPFVSLVPPAGGWGRNVTILGTNLTGATAVSFNGTPATFTVVSPTEITTTVPSGATKGSVTVTTPSGTLTSNVIFVLP